MSLLELADLSISKMGRVKVAKYYPGKEAPFSDGYKNIIIHTSSSNLGGDLSPYILRNEKGQLLENIWQFSKIYSSVDAQKTWLSRFQPDNIIWYHPSEIHAVSDPTGTWTTTTEYWMWRNKGMNNKYAVRYPNGFNGRHKCLCSLWPSAQNPDVYESLGYVEARKKIYCSEYIRLAPHTKHFKKLQALLNSGVNLQIVEVDGPDCALDFPPYDRISHCNPGLDINEETIRMLINDSRKPFGHGYVIAALLLGGASWMQ